MEARALSLSCGLRFNGNAVCLSTFARSFLLALGSVDGIHRGFHLAGRVNRSNQGLDDSETEACHLSAHGSLYVGSHIVLAGKSIVKGQHGDGAPQGVFHVGPQLPGGILQLIVSLSHICSFNTELG